MIPARAARSQTRGRPPFADRDVDGNKGSITAQRPSETSMADINRYSNRTNPPASGFKTPSKHDQLVGAGKPAKVALVAVMRKLIILANALLRDGRTWTEIRP